MITFIKDLYKWVVMNKRVHKNRGTYLIHHKKILLVLRSWTAQVLKLFGRRAQNWIAPGAKSATVQNTLISNTFLGIKSKHVTFPVELHIIMSRQASTSSRIYDAFDGVWNLCFGNDFSPDGIPIFSCFGRKSLAVGKNGSDTYINTGPKENSNQ